MCFRHVYPSLLYPSNGFLSQTVSFWLLLKRYIKLAGAEGSTTSTHIYYFSISHQLLNTVCQSIQSLWMVTFIKTLYNHQEIYQNQRGKKEWTVNGDTRLKKSGQLMETSSTVVFYIEYKLIWSYRQTLNQH